MIDPVSYQHEVYQLIDVAMAKTINNDDHER